MFSNVPIVGFPHGKTFKDYLVRAPLSIQNNSSGSETCGKRNYQVCQFTVNTDNFSPITTDEIFNSNNVPLNCNSKKVV